MGVQRLGETPQTASGLSCRPGDGAITACTVAAGAPDKGTRWCSRRGHRGQREGVVLATEEWLSATRRCATMDSDAAVREAFAPGLAPPADNRSWRRGRRRRHERPVDDMPVRRPDTVVLASELNPPRQHAAFDRQQRRGNRPAAGQEWAHCGLDLPVSHAGHMRGGDCRPATRTSTSARLLRADFFNDPNDRVALGPMATSSDPQ